VSETIESARRWSGFVCPDCRFIFRVPKDHDGEGVICPNCRRMLRIPHPGEPTPALVAKAGLNIVPVSLPESIQRNREKRRQEGEAGVETQARAVVHTGAPAQNRRRRGARQDDGPDWEKAPEQRVRVGRRKRMGTGRILAIVFAVLSLVGALLVFMKPEEPSVEPIAVAPQPEVAPKPVEEPGTIALPAEMSGNESALIAELEPIARKFLEAESVEEMLPLVRDPERVESKMRVFYAKGVNPPGMGQFNSTKTVNYRGKLAAVAVRTLDFELKQLAFIRNPDGMKIDWESYVGWSDMPWTAFVAEKPESPVLFRAKLSKSDYFNFQFSNDVEWKCYQLTSPDDETTLYGYVKVGSDTDRQLAPADGNGVNMVTLKLKYPAGEKQRNQVLIDSQLADGWVEGIGN
jgi:hypothetical protein